MWLLYALSASILWGMCYSLDEKILNNKVSPVILLFIQVASALIVYSIIVFSTTLKSEFALIQAKKENIWLLSAAALCALIANLLICLSIKEKNATLAAIIELMYPLFTIIFSYLLFRQIHLNFSIICGGLLIISGAAVIILFG